MHSRAQQSTLKSQSLMRSSEFVLTARDFERVCALIHRDAGIALSPAKVEMVYGRLSRRLRATGKTSFSAYLDWLEGQGAASERQHFINTLTTNLTSFFREPHHFQILGDRLKALRAQSAGRRWRLWSCACSTGEEAYSLAMTAVEAWGGWDVPVQIIGSDVDTQVLEQAARGIYERSKVATLTHSRLQQFFLQGQGQDADRVRIKPELQRLVSFMPINLLAPTWPVQGPFDAVFCRNVMIYFDKATQMRVLEHLAAQLAPDGWFYAGHSESFHGMQSLIALRERTVYELAHAAAPRRRL